MISYYLSLPASIILTICGITTASLVVLLSALVVLLIGRTLGSSLEKELTAQAVEDKEEDDPDFPYGGI